MKKQKERHGETKGGKKSSEYCIWRGIKTRCLNPNCKSFKSYGDRGIGLSQEWYSFSSFFQDMGRRPSKNHSIERIDNNLGYSKENCEWATMKQQTRNKRSNILISLNGETMCLKDMANKYSIPYPRAYSRFQKGMSPQEILSSENYGDKTAFKLGSKRIFPKTWKQDNDGKFRKPIK